VCIEEVLELPSGGKCPFLSPSIQIWLNVESNGWSTILKDIKLHLFGAHSAEVNLATQTSRRVRSYHKTSERIDKNTDTTGLRSIPCLLQEAVSELLPVAKLRKMPQAVLSQARYINTQER